MRCPACGGWLTRDEPKRMFSCDGTPNAMTVKGRSGCGWSALDREISALIKAGYAAAAKAAR